MSDTVNPVYDDDGNAEWGVAGYLDFDGVYHDLEDKELPGGFWESDVDLLTISWVDAADGTLQYARLEGPYEDLDDIEDKVDTYFEEGS